MANPKFPSIFECVMLDGASYKFQDNIIRSDFGTIPKSRRRFTNPYEDVTLRVFCKSEAEMQVIYDFCIYTCSDVLPFDWVEWRDPARRPAVYSFQERPTFTPAGNGRWYADLKLMLRTPFNGMFILTNEIYIPIANEIDEALTT